MARGEGSWHSGRHPCTWTQVHLAQFSDFLNFFRSKKSMLRKFVYRGLRAVDSRVLKMLTERSTGR